MCAEDFAILWSRKLWTTLKTKVIGEDSENEELTDIPSSRDSPKVLQYPMMFWVEHGRLSGLKAKDIVHERQDFWRPDSSIRSSWLRDRRLNGVFPDGTSDYGPAIDLAAYYGLTAVCEELLSLRRSDFKLRDSIGDFPLCLAARNGHEQTVELLIRSGVDVNSESWGCNTALYEAVLSENTAIVEQLLESGADVNIQGWPIGSALQTAILLGYKLIAELLLKNGANVNAHSKAFGSPLHIALANHDEALVELLLEYGAKGLIPKSEGRNPLVGWSMEDESLGEGTTSDQDGNDGGSI
ncbi:MAG: hypothetical protein M1818_001545 [Claussenomyces sp. TS43310]|nr:MAG: hypothetical protein M1818_001545 [Claussenomyces sp. TS43310]